MSVCGLLAEIAVHEDCMTKIELEAVTFLNKLPQLPDATNSLSLQGQVAKDALPRGGFSKRQLHEAGPNGGSPIKKFKSGPFEAFTHEELGSEPSSQASIPSSNSQLVPGAGSSSGNSVISD
ncbi:hypothetical protein FRC10_009287 [Ceratobasidium sp. 414]|nr:hypothetical protein FRC10_009287 [Ceratobasidium sp. 414]